MSLPSIPTSNPPPANPATVAPVRLPPRPRCERRAASRRVASAAVFPCFDEPGYKATFAARIAVPDTQPPLKVFFNTAANGTAVRSNGSAVYAPQRPAAPGWPRRAVLGLE